MELGIPKEIAGGGRERERRRKIVGWEFKIGAAVWVRAPAELET